MPIALTISVYNPTKVWFQGTVVFQLKIQHPTLRKKNRVKPNPSSSLVMFVKLLTCLNAKCSSIQHGDIAWDMYDKKCVRCIGSI